jgi:hypothetical protein
MSSTPPIQLFKQLFKKETTIKLSQLKHILIVERVPPTSI